MDSLLNGACDLEREYEDRAEVLNVVFALVFAISVWQAFEMSPREFLIVR